MQTLTIATDIIEVLKAGIFKHHMSVPYIAIVHDISIDLVSKHKDGSSANGPIVCHFNLPSMDSDVSIRCI